MSLITRCPACGTMFKVVTDQLKVSQGWVRCGHCAEVFDASLHLQLAQAPAVPAQPVPDAPLQTHATPASFPEAPVSSAAQPLAQVDTRRSEFDPANWRQQQAPQPDEAGGLHLNEQDEVPRSMPAQAEPAAHMDDGYELPDFRAEDPSSVLPQDDAPDETGDVSFVRDARRKAFWRKPAVRITLGVTSLLLAAVLLLQVLVQQRDSVAAFEPTLKPWLQKLCEQLHCEVHPLRHIEAIVIDSSSFNKVDADAYRLSFSLKNTGAAPVAMPALEVTLTDSQEQALVRRVLTPAQFGAGNTMLVAGADFSGAVLMQVPAADSAGAAAPLRIAGYRVLAFYP